MSSARLGGVASVAVGVLFLASGLYVAHERLGFLDRSLEATAVVIVLDWEETEECDPDYGCRTVETAFPVFEFIDSRTGGKVTARGSVGSGFPQYSVGQEVEILYDPENPTVNVTVKSFWDIWLLSIALPVAGVAFIVLGVLIRRRWS